MRALLPVLAVLTWWLPVGLLPASSMVSLAGPGSSAGSVSSTGPAVAPASVGSYRTPVAGAMRVLRGFSPPVVRYRAGHLGVDLADPTSAVVLAAGAGRVRFAGSVAGRGVVVIAHPDGISTEYEPVTAAVSTGDLVRPGQPIGRLTGRHRGCPAAGCLHWGASRAGNYLDPLTLLQPLGVVRLLPWDSG